MPTDPLGEAIQILQLVNAIEPAAIGLVKTFLAGIKGKSKEQLLAESNDIWQSIIDTANAELATQPKAE